MSAYVVDRHHIAYLVKYAEELGVLRELNLNVVSVAHILVSENVASIHHRYPDTLDNLERFPGSVDTLEPFSLSELEQYHWDGYNPLQVIKAIACYKYQSCEHEDWPQSMAKALMVKLMEVAIWELPGMDTCLWGAPLPVRQGSHC